MNYFLLKLLKKLTYFSVADKNGEQVKMKRFKLDAPYRSFDLESIDEPRINDCSEKRNASCTILSTENNVNTQVIESSVIEKILASRPKSKNGMNVNVKTYSFFIPAKLGIPLQKSLEHIAFANLLRDEITLNTIDLSSMQNTLSEIPAIANQTYDESTVTSYKPIRNMSENSNSDKLQSKSQGNIRFVRDILEEFRHVLEEVLKKKHNAMNQMMTSIVNTHHLPTTNIKIIIDALNDRYQKNKKRNRKQKDAKKDDLGDPFNNGFST